MRGYDGKTTKNNISDEFSFEFGAQGEFRSDFDAAAVKLYKALGDLDKSNAKDLKETKPSDHDMMPQISQYFSDCVLKDDKLIWQYADSVITEHLEKQVSTDQDQNLLTEQLKESKKSNSIQTALRKAIKNMIRQQEEFTICVFGESG